MRVEFDGFRYDFTVVESVEGSYLKDIVVLRIRGHVQRVFPCSEWVICPCDFPAAIPEVSVAIPLVPKSR